MPGTDGLLHVSEIANHRVKDVRDELKEGEQILVKVINIDPTGKIRLSRKALLQPEEGAAAGTPEKLSSACNVRAGIAVNMQVICFPVCRDQLRNYPTTALAAITWGVVAGVAMII